MTPMKETKKPQKDLPVYPVRLQPEVVERLREKADRKGWSLHQLMVDVLSKFATKKAA